MKLKFHKMMLSPAFVVAGPRLLLSQEPPVSQPKPAQTQAQSATKGLSSPEEALEQLSRRIAAIYREMAVISESDPVPVRELKRQYGRLAEHEESAALAAKMMATYHAQLVALIRQSADVTKRVKFGDPAYRK